MIHKIIKEIQLHLQKGTLARVFINLLKKPVNKFNHRFPGFKRDLSNFVRFGRNAPLYQERIWVNPQEVELFIDKHEIERVTGGLNRTKASGYVAEWENVRNARPVMEEYKMKYCFQHWVEGKSWDELGVYDFMIKNSVRYQHYTRDEIAKRFEMLDRAFEQVRIEQRLKTRQEIDPDNFREKDGILIHIGPDGTPYFGGGGYHRLAMAKIIELEKIPASIGVVSKQALRHLHKFRERSV